MCHYFHNVFLPPNKNISLFWVLQFIYTRIIIYCALEQLYEYIDFVTGCWFSMPMQIVNVDYHAEIGWNKWTTHEPYFHIKMNLMWRSGNCFGWVYIFPFFFKFRTILSNHMKIKGPKGSSLHIERTGTPGTPTIPRRCPGDHPQPSFHRARDEMRWAQISKINVNHDFNHHFNHHLITNIQRYSTVSMDLRSDLCPCCWPVELPCPCPSWESASGSKKKQAMDNSEEEYYKSIEWHSHSPTSANIQHPISSNHAETPAWPTIGPRSATTPAIQVIQITYIYPPVDMHRWHPDFRRNQGVNL